MRDRLPSSRRTLLATALVLVLLVVAAAAQVVDPHHPAEHAGQDRTSLDCATCHDCNLPTHEDPCLRACPRFHGHFVGDHDWGEGPEVVVIDQLTDIYGPVTFSHRLHAEMSAMTGGCTNCHHYSEASGTIPPCRECHDPDRADADLRKPSLKGAYHRQCINCHLDWAHENACGFCHQESESHKMASAQGDPSDMMGQDHPRLEAPPYYAYETPYEDGPVVTFHHEDHVEQFGLRCVDCHQGDSCSRCHDTATGSAAEHVKIDHVTTCGTCHQERDCGFCHSDEVSPSFHHAETAGFHLDPHHTDVACETCHGEPQQFRTPAGTCTGCHIHWEDGAFDHRVTGVALDEMHADFGCRDCHLEGNFAVAPSCVDCHGEELFPDMVPGERLDD